MSPFRHPRLLRALLVLGAMAFLGLTLIMLASCGSPRQTSVLSARVTGPDGKLVANVTGSIARPQSWAERNLGPAGTVLRAASDILLAVLPFVP